MRKAGECLTARECADARRRVVEIMQAHATGAMSDAQARHELRNLIAPVKRRVRRLVRIQAAREGVRRW